MEDNPHPHAELIARAAELAKTTQDVAGHFEFRKSKDTNLWYTCTGLNFNPEYEYREIVVEPKKTDEDLLKALNVTPMLEEPKLGDTYYCALTQDGGYRLITNNWDDDKVDKLLFAARMCFSSHENAINYIALNAYFTSKLN